jgi:hypothetical protein
MESTQKHWWIVVGLGMALPAMADEGSGNPSAVRVNEAIALDSITVPVPMPAISPSPTPASEPLPEFEDNFAEMIDGLYASPADWDEGFDCRRFRVDRGGADRAHRSIHTAIESASAGGRFRGLADVSDRVGGCVLAASGGETGRS